MKIKFWTRRSRTVGGLIGAVVAAGTVVSGPAASAAEPSCVLPFATNNAATVHQSGDITSDGWFKAMCSGNTGNCVEVKFDNDMVLVRDSKDNGNGPVLTFNHREWACFLEGVRNNEFELPALQASM